MVPKLIWIDGTVIELKRQNIEGCKIWMGGNPVKGLSFYVEELDIEQVTGEIQEQPEMYPPIVLGTHPQ